MVYRQLAWGLDATIQIPPWLLTVPGDYADMRGLPVCFHPEVQIRELTEHEDGEQYPSLSKEYITPAGSLSVRVSKTDDWPYGDHIPFLDDFIIPRARKPLVTSRVDLKALRYLMISPTDDVIQEFREAARRAKAFAREHDILVSGGMGVGADMAGWFCGFQNLIYLTVDDPAFVEDLIVLPGRPDVVRSLLCAALRLAADHQADYLVTATGRCELRPLFWELGFESRARSAPAAVITAADILDAIT